MARLFYLLSAVALSMILVTGLGVYWLSKAETVQTKENSADLVAKSVALSISAQIDLLNRALDKMVQDPEVLIAVNSRDPLLLDSVALKLEKHFPDALKIRLLLPGVSEPDQRYVPRMGFADLDMVRETFIKNQLPSIQGDKGDRHLALARRVVDKGKAVGVILASLNYDFVSKSLQSATINSGYMELRQGKLVLSAAGQKIDADAEEAVNIKVANTDWELHYQYEGGAVFNNLLIVSSLILLCLLFSTLALFATHKRVSQLLTEDLRSVMRAFKDMMSYKMQGSYPVQLIEMSTAISILAQFKRVKDSSDNESASSDDNDLNLVIGDDENFELDDFFYETDDIKL